MGGGGWLAGRAHPFTGFRATGAVIVLAVLLPTPEALLGLYTAVLGLALAAGQGRAVRHGVLVAAPLWAFLLILHGGFGDPPYVVWGWSWSRSGLALTVAQGARLGAIITGSLATWYAFDPARFLDAMAEKSRRFPALWVAGFLVTTTIDTVHRFRVRAGTILDAQRARGLPFSGSPVRRLGALRPLIVPLVLNALIDVDTRALALETRGLSARPRQGRTPLAPRRMSGVDRALTWLGLVAIVGAAVWRLV